MLQAHVIQHIAFQDLDSFAPALQPLKRAKAIPGGLRLDLNHLGCSASFMITWTGYWGTRLNWGH
jgi:hypothetical protein